MKPTGIALIAGLGNPGSQYAATRHNVGFWFMDRLQLRYPINFSSNKKFKAKTGEFRHQNEVVRAVAPSTFMNLSGESIAPMASFYRIEPEQILVIHDDLDFDPGVVRFKAGGGHGCHNGLRNIADRLGSGNFPRIRIGIGHPGIHRDVSNYVLTRPPLAEVRKIEDAIDRAVAVMPEVLAGNYQQAMNTLHRDSPGPEQ